MKLPVLIAAALLQPVLALDALKQLTSSRVDIYGSGGADFKNGAGELETLTFSARSFLSEPISLGGDWSLIPTFVYEATLLRYDDTPAGFPVRDEDLHTLQLPLYGLRYSEDSPWIFGTYLRLGLSTDFDHIDGDDLFFDAGVALAYRFNDKFIAGIGAVVLDAFGDDTLIPGAGFIWSPCENVSVSLLGPVFLASWNASENWRFNVDVRYAGGTWNIDSNDRSRILTFRSYRAGLHAQRRLWDQWWLEGGAGVTFANKVELKTPGGSGRFESTLDRLDEGYYGYLALKKEIW